MNNKRLLLIDGNSLLFRAFYATYYGDPSAIMRTSSGTPTNAIFAFSNMLCKLLATLAPGDSIALAFDKDSHTFRKEEFASYKANRKPVPEELVVQFAPARDLVKSLGIPCYEQHGIEADDICGTLDKMAEKEGYRVEIYTSDKDYLQLVSDATKVNLLKKGLSEIDAITPEKMQEEFGFSPLQIIDYKGLRGDSSDNLPGIPGVGEKTATKLIQEYHSFDAIIEAAKGGRIKGKLGEHIIEGEQMGRLCYELATMKTDCELPFSLSDLLYLGYDINEISRFAKEYELKSLLARLPRNFKKQGEAPSLTCPEPQEISSLQGVALDGPLGIAIDVDPSSYQDAPVLGIALADAKHVYYLTAASLVADEAAKALLADPKISKIAYDAKRVEVALSRLGLSFAGVSFDFLLAAYLLDSASSSSEELVFSSFGVDVSSEETLLSSSNFLLTGKIAYYSLALAEEAKKKLEKDGSDKLFREIELPLAHVLAKMEIEGFPLVGSELEEIGKAFREKRDELLAELQKMRGKPFNPASPKQVAEFLYDELGLKAPKSRSTSVEELSYLASFHDAPKKILEYRKYAKLVGTYIDGLLPHIHQDGKIHTCFNQALTSTGRLSSSNPNLQNISTRDEESKEIRKAFHYAPNSFKILSLDYSQIELRLLASLSGCQKYLDVFSSNRDVHSETARAIFQVPEGSEVPHELRRKAKAINFAIIYGTTAFGLAEQINGTPKEAASIIASFYATYPEIARYLNSIVDGAEKNGYVETLFHRRRYLPELKDGNYMRREAAKRAALNAPVQGSAADLIKVAMLRVDKLLSEGKYKSKMVLQIHDELLFALDPQEEKELLPLLKQAMENAIPLKVKLSVEGSVGDSWYEAKD